MKECSFTPKIDPHSDEIAKNAQQRQSLLNQFSALDMGNDLHEITELQQSPNFRGTSNFEQPVLESQSQLLAPYYGNLILNAGGETS